MPGDLSELERLMSEHDWRARQREKRSRLSDGVFRAHRSRQLANPSKLAPLRRVRLAYHGEGIPVEAPAEKALVGASTIRGIETGEPGSDLTYARLAHALNCRRDQIDPSWVKL